MRSLLLCLILSATAACGRSAQGAVATRAHGLPGDRLTLIVGGIPIDSPVTAVPVVADLTVGARVAPSAERHGRSLTLTLRRPSGPVADAEVIVNGSMPFMSHGAFRVAAVAADADRYVAELPLEMPGEWRLSLEIASGTDVGRMELQLETFD